MAGEPGAGDILSAVYRAGSARSQISRTRKRGETVVCCACGLAPVIVVNTLTVSHYFLASVSVCTLYSAPQRVVPLPYLL